MNGDPITPEARAAVEGLLDITPNFNLQAYQRYADKHETRDPQSHVSGRLEVLSHLSELATDPETTGDDLRRAIREFHIEASAELLTFFAGRP